MPIGTRSIAIAPDLADALAIQAKQQQKFEQRAVSMRELAELGIEWVLAELEAATAAGHPLTLRELSAKRAGRASTDAPMG